LTKIEVYLEIRVCRQRNSDISSLQANAFSSSGKFVKREKSQLTLSQHYMLNIFSMFIDFPLTADFRAASHIINAFKPSKPCTTGFLFFKTHFIK